MEMIPKLGEHVRFLHDNFGDDERFTFFFRQVFDWGGKRVNSMRSSMILNRKNDLRQHRIIADEDRRRTVAEQKSHSTSAYPL